MLSYLGVLAASVGRMGESKIKGLGPNTIETKSTGINAGLMWEKLLNQTVGETVRRERRWTSAGAIPARELVRSTR